MVLTPSVRRGRLSPNHRRVLESYGFWLGTDSDDDAEVRGSSFGDDVMPQPPVPPTEDDSAEEDELVEMRPSYVQRSVQSRSLSEIVGQLPAPDVQVVPPPAPRVQVRSRTWCLTVFNEDFVKAAERWHPGTLGIDGAVWQVEESTLGRLHVQLAVHFKNARSFDQVKAKFPVGVHIEAAKGTWAQAAAYCRKQETRVSGPWVYGEDPVVKASYRVNLRFGLY